MPHVRIANILVLILLGCEMALRLGFVWLAHGPFGPFSADYVGASLVVATAVGAVELFAYLAGAYIIRSTIVELMQGHNACCCFKPPSVVRLALGLCFLIALSVASFQVSLDWGIIVQCSVFLFLLAKGHDYGEMQLTSLHDVLRKVGSRSVKGNALGAYKFKLSLATQCVLLLESGTSALVLVEKAQYGFSDMHLLIDVSAIGLAVAIPIYLLGMMPYFYYSRKGAFAGKGTAR